MLSVTDKCGFAAGGSKLVAECPTCGEGQSTATIHDILTNLGLLTNLQGCWDAGDVACYDGSGTVVTNRAGGGVNLNLVGGAAHAGTPGGRSGREYFATGAPADKLQYTAMPAWADWSRQNASFTAAAWVLPRLNGSAAGLQHLGSNYLAGTSAGYWSGLAATVDAAGGLVSLAGCYGASNSYAYWTQRNLAPAPIIRLNCWNFIAISIAEAVAGGSYHYANGQYVPIDFKGAPGGTSISPSDTITADYIAGPVGYEQPNYWCGATDAEGRKSRIGAILHWANTTGASAALTKAQLDQIYNATKARYGH